MKYCNNCGNQLRDEARFCDKCGASSESSSSTNASPSPSPQKKITKSKKSHKKLIVAIIIIIGMFIIYNLAKEKSKSPDSYGTTSNYKKNTQITKYVHKPVNVREGRSTKFKIVGKLSRGEKVKVDSLDQGWLIVYDPSNNKMGYASAKLLKDAPIPPFEVVTWNWRKDPNFGTKGAIIYTVEVRNNTNKYVSSLRVDFATYDKNGNVMDATFLYVSGLQPGGTSSDKSYATYFGNEKKASIRIDPNQNY
jgi:uncharacterized protein YgiM (DUF1202 family)